MAHDKHATRCEGCRDYCPVEKLVDRGACFCAGAHLGLFEGSPGIPLRRLLYGRGTWWSRSCSTDPPTGRPDCRLGRTEPGRQLLNQKRKHSAGHFRKVNCRPVVSAVAAVDRWIKWHWWLCSGRLNGDLVLQASERLSRMQLIASALPLQSL